MLPSMDAIRVVAEMIERMATALERIADALEAANARKEAP